MAGPSKLEQKFFAAWVDASQERLPAPLCHENGGEQMFHPTRKWRFDFCWPELMIAVEIHGGTFARSRGRHSRGIGHTEDFEKHNEATRLGWDVYYFTAKDLSPMEKALESAVFIVEAVSERLDELNRNGKL